MMMNNQNPITQMFSMFQQMQNSGQNPQMLMQQMFGNNPNYQRAMQMIQGKSPEQLQQVAMNLAQQRGIDKQQMQSLISQFGGGQQL